MYNITLTPEQERLAKTELCAEGNCLRCNAPLLQAETRFLAEIPYRTKKHLYMNCFIVCHTCYEDKKGTTNWLNNLDEQEVLYAAKDRSIFVVTMR